jgi:hypothetical protein
MKSSYRKQESFKDLVAEKHRQQRSDRAAMADGKIRQSDLGLFSGFDRRKARIVQA